MYNFNVVACHTFPKKTVKHDFCFHCKLDIVVTMFLLGVTRRVLPLKGILTIYAADFENSVSSSSHTKTVNYLDQTLQAEYTLP